MIKGFLIAGIVLIVVVVIAAVAILNYGGRNAT